MMMGVLSVLVTVALSFVLSYGQHVLTIYKSNDQYKVSGTKTRIKLNPKKVAESERLLVKDSKVYDLFTGKELLTVGEVLTFIAA